MFWAYFFSSKQHGRPHGQGRPHARAAPAHKPAGKAAAQKGGRKGQGRKASGRKHGQKLHKGAKPQHAARALLARQSGETDQSGAIDFSSILNTIFGLLKRDEIEMLARADPTDQSGAINFSSILNTIFGLLKRDEIEMLARADPSTQSDRKSTRLNSSHSGESRMPSSA